MSKRAWGSVVVKALRYKSEGPAIDPHVAGVFSVASDSSMCPGVDSASKNEYQVNPGGKSGRCVRLTTYHPHVPMSRNLGALTSWNRVGLFRPAMGQLYLYLFINVSVRIRMTLIVGRTNLNELVRTKKIVRNFCKSRESNPMHECKTKKRCYTLSTFRITCCWKQPPPLKEYRNILSSLLRGIQSCSYVNSAGLM